MIKQHDIYGIGNALVDTVIEVTQEDLTTLNVEKGVMSLIDETQHHQFQTYFKSRITTKACGGSAANTLIGAAQMGANCVYSCRIAGDDDGLFYQDDLTNNGVQSSVDKLSLPAGKTGACFVLVSDDADRSMATYLGISSKFQETDIEESFLANSNLLYIEGYLVTTLLGKTAAISAKKKAEQLGVKTAITLSDPNIVSIFKEGFNEIIDTGVDLLFCNEQEALTFSGEATRQGALDYLKTRATSCVITLGAEGALVWDGKSTHTISGHSVDAIDTNGAGDLFAGVFLAALSKGMSHVKAAEDACLASAKLVTQFGPRLTIEVLHDVFQ